MILAKVLESVVSTQKNPHFEGKTIFSVQPLNEGLKPHGSAYLAFDHVQSGPGDIVLICREGNGCRQMWGNDQAPVNAVIAAIVDHIELE
ncbi:MAG: EutN/CcmL family microcompartment protein [Oligoflexia bacterium]|nr:EutN/CcmL family microcompartment protein [Oligoflexia bacterium]